MRESIIEQYLVDRVIALGGEVRKVKWIGRRGAPDRLVMLPKEATKLHRLNADNKYVETIEHIRPSFCTWVELKAPGEKPKPHQAREHERMRAMGQCVVVIDSIEGVDRLVGLRDGR